MNVLGETENLVPTIGLEIHAELKTETKMFCDSKNDPDETRANVNICPVCMAHPGALPVINREAVRKVMTVGAALGGTLADYTEFDRKNYFYPDLPKGYQLSQYEHPLVSGGELNGIQLTRIHLEEDTASSIHDDATGDTLIDYNRAGVPLMELVTEPVIHSAEEAGVFARELQLVLRTLDCSRANMEKGEMRVEANISVAKKGERGVKVEIKNLNSFRSMERAVEFEIERQSTLLHEGKTVLQETRGWDEVTQKTFSQRTKETSADYRYFPDPDLPSLKLSEIDGMSLGSLEVLLPELPAARRARYEAIGLKRDDARMFADDLRFGKFFDTIIEAFAGKKEELLLAANYLANDIAKEIRDIETQDSRTYTEIPISSLNFNTLISKVYSEELSSKAAKQVLTLAIKEKRDVSEIVESLGISQKSSADDLGPVLEQVIREYPKAVEEYKNGKINSLQFLIGMAMKASKGAGNPSAIREMLTARLSK